MPFRALLHAASKPWTMGGVEAKITMLTRFNRKPVSRPSAARQRGDGGRPPRLRGEHRHLFAAGETIPESGIYEVIHHDAHRETHESVLVKGSSFPFCEVCEAKVPFQAVRMAPYIFDDEDFGEE